MLRLFLAISLILLTSCPSPLSRSLRIEFLVRESCGRTPRHFNISCVGALEVSVVGVKTQCTDISNRFVDLQEMVGYRDPLIVLDHLEGEDEVSIEVRGYHVFEKKPCSDVSDDDLMLWGSSEMINLADRSIEHLNVEIECRPECDCVKLETDPQACPRELVTGICAPKADSRPCRRTCSSDEECHKSLFGCRSDTCDAPDALEGAQCCDPPLGGLCARCAFHGDCDSNLCAVNTLTEENFCATPCPPWPDVTPCPRAMACKRINNEVYSEGANRSE